MNITLEKLFHLCLVPNFLMTFGTIKIFRLEKKETYPLGNDRACMRVADGGWNWKIIVTAWNGSITLKLKI